MAAGDSAGSDDGVVGTGAAADILRLLSDVEGWVEAARGQPDPDPAVGSDLANDAQALEPYYPWHLAWSSRRVALSYMDTLRQLLTTVGSVHTHPPLGLLRGGLEAAALHLWLVRPDDHLERCRRGMLAWHRDLNDRAGFEAITGWQPPREGLRATARQAELLHLAHGLGLSVKQRDLRYSTTQIIATAASEIGVAQAEAKRLWSLSSGLAHGRYWPSIIGGLTPGTKQVSAAGGYAVSLTVSDDHLLDMTRLAHRVMAAGRHWQSVRCAAPAPHG